MTELGALFAAALLAATLIPAQSEALLAGLVIAGDTAPWLLVLIATAGNVLGAVVNWLLGRAIERFRDRRWFPVRPEALTRAQGWYRRWGRWSLLFSWLPLVGDPLTLAAGTMREPLWSFLPLVTVGKAARYALLAYGAAAAGG